MTIVRSISHDGESGRPDWSVLDAVPALVAFVDRDERYLYANDIYRQWFGIEPADILGRTIAGVVGETVYRELRPAIARVLSGEAVAFAQSVGPRVARRDLRGLYAPHFDRGGDVRGFLVFLSDNTELARRDAQAAEQRDVIEAILTASPVPMALFDRRGICVQAGKAFADLVGHAPERVVGRSYSDFTHPDDRAEEDWRVDRVLEGSVPSITGAKRYLAHGTQSVVAAETVRRVGSKAQPSQFIVVATSEHEARSSPPDARLRDRGAGARVGISPAAARQQDPVQRDWASRASVPARSGADGDAGWADVMPADPMTGVISRQGMVDVLTILLDRARTHGRRVALVLAEVSRMRSVNAVAGHAMGDLLLVDVAIHLLVRCSPTTEVGRWSGDTFAMLMPDVTDADAVFDEVSRITAGLQKAVDPVIADAVRVGMRFGASIFPDHGGGVEDMIAAAERALMDASNKKVDTCVVSSRSLADKALERAEAEAVILRCLRTDGFRLAYQPRIDLSSGAVRTVEALLRLPDVALKIPIGRLIDHAERLGLSAEINDWVFDEACRQVAAWRDTPLGSLGVSIKMSAVAIADRALHGRVLETLARHGVPAQRFEIEVTEGTRPDRTALLGSCLDEFRALGFRVAVDDFGAGLTSLDELRRLPVDVVKLDRSYIAAIGRSDTLILQSLLDLARALGKRVVAEGVETTQQLKWLQRAGCDEAQGMVWTPPLAAEALAAFLERRPGALEGRKLSPFRRILPRRDSRQRSH